MAANMLFLPCATSVYPHRFRSRSNIKQNKADPARGLSSGGSIINVASVVAVMGAATPQLACTSGSFETPCQTDLPADTASKGAVLALTRELAMVHAREDIRFNALCP